MWTEQDIPDLHEKTALVTGANSGLGLAVALELARKGARVFLGCRDPHRGDRAVETIVRLVPGADARLLALDLASLASIREAVARLNSSVGALDLLVNNAGVMALPYSRTIDGFERQLGTNHFGHFALTGLLLELLARAPSPRVVTHASLMHRFGRIRFDDLHAERRRYSKWGAYSQSKLANLLFAFEFARRLEARGSQIVSVAAHPGYAATQIAVAGPVMEGAKFKAAVMRLGSALVAQSASKGALPALHAATAPGVTSGEFYGPSGFLQLRGGPVKVPPSARALDLADGARLWALSAEATGVRYLMGEEG